MSDGRRKINGFSCPGILVAFLISKRFIKANAWTNKSQSLYNQEIYNSERGVSTWGMMIFPVCFLSKKANFWHCFIL